MSALKNIVGKAISIVGVFGIESAETTKHAVSATMYMPTQISEKERKYQEILDLGKQIKEDGVELQKALDKTGTHLDAIQRRIKAENAKPPWPGL